MPKKKEKTINIVSLQKNSMSIAKEIIQNFFSWNDSAINKNTKKISMTGDLFRNS